MKCISCGLPLSPSRTTTNCPRCGTPINAGQKAASTSVQQEYPQTNWGTAGVVEAGAGPPPSNYQWAQNMQASPLPQTPQQASQQGQIWLQGPASQPGFSPGPPRQVTPPRNSRNTKLGFVVAGLCVLAGGMLLIFVYFLAIGLPGSNSNNTATATTTSNVSTPTTAPTATAALSPTTPIYPGQQYIDNAQMANTVDTNSLQPSQLSTTFKTGQKIYVAFHVHPPHSGAVCLTWYLNGNQFAQYSFPIGANSKLSYAYAIYSRTGPAYVQLYWASTTQCTDQVLAQQVDFTVTN
jgi:predicted RNA-binding Zn-ribbon protein involved in translation (DUF1610 family)